MKRFWFAILITIFVVSSASASIIVNWLEKPIHMGANTSGLPTFFQIDIDGDKIIDFTFLSTLGLLSLLAEGDNQVIVVDSPPLQGGAVGPLEEGCEIGEHLADELEWDVLGGYVPISSWYMGGSFGEFAGQQAYVGISFYIGEKVYYGWIYLDIPETSGAGNGWIYGWGYESASGTPILAGAGRPGVVPEPSTLALLSLGAAALAWRRKHALRPNLAENSSKTG